MAKKKPQFECPKCYRKFTTNRGLASHSRVHPYVPPVPPPEPKEHVNFMDLVKGSYYSWGVSMTEKERKSPSMDQLKLGALFLIVKYLIEILNELKRPKQIS